MPPLVKRWRLTVDDYRRMAKAGILHEDDRVELIEGELIEMAAVGRFIVSIQNPIRLSHYSEPEPDVVLLRPRDDDYESALPGPTDILLVIEVADTTLGYDRRVKLPLYATAGIAEMWLVNLPRRSIEVHREPQGNRYQQVSVYRKGEHISPLLLPELAVPVDALLP
jgi:Uma2 family endonuclease